MSYIIYKNEPNYFGVDYPVYYTGEGFSPNQDEAKKFDKWREVLVMILQIILSFLTMSNLKYKKI